MVAFALLLLLVIVSGLDSLWQEVFSKVASKHPYSTIGNIKSSLNLDQLRERQKLLRLWLYPSLFYVRFMSNHM